MKKGRLSLIVAEIIEPEEFLNNKDVFSFGQILQSHIFKDVRNFAQMFSSDIKWN